MRVALFFDGKNHMKALRRSADDRWLDHGSLARWVTQHVGGSTFAGAHYYTGVPTSEEPSERHALTDLLEELDRRPGFFVHRFQRRAVSRDCPHCHQGIAYTEEKCVDTALVADLVLQGARDAYDVAVVFSGDLDIAPGLEAVHSLGKQAWIATFGDSGLSRSLTRSAWGVINLLEHLEDFSYSDLAVPAHQAPDDPTDVDREMLRELRRAEAHFTGGGGFVGAHYFVHRWKGHRIPDTPEGRRQALQRLMAVGAVETYEADGKTALRSLLEESELVSGPPQEDVSAEEDDATVEIRVTDALRSLRRRVALVSERSPDADKV